MVKKLPQLKRGLKDFILDEDAKVMDKAATKIAITSSFIAINMLANADEANAKGHKNHSQHQNRVNADYYISEDCDYKGLPDNATIPDDVEDSEDNLSGSSINSDIKIQNKIFGLESDNRDDPVVPPVNETNQTNQTNQTNPPIARNSSEFCEKGALPQDVIHAGTNPSVIQIGAIPDKALDTTHGNHYNHNDQSGQGYLEILLGVIIGALLGPLIGIGAGWGAGIGLIGGLFGGDDGDDTSVSVAKSDGHIIPKEVLDILEDQEELVTDNIEDEFDLGGNISE